MSKFNNFSADTPSKSMNSSDVSAEISNASSNTNIIQAVVVDSFQDPSLLDKKKLSEIFDSFNDVYKKNFLSLDEENKNFYLKIPRNSLLLNIEQSANSEIYKNNVIAFPFFSSHLMLPVKPGEHVWCFKIKNKNLPTDSYYWITRVHGNDSYEDVNYTHENRKIYDVKNINFTPIDGIFIPNFTIFNQENANSSTFKIENDNINPFDKIINNTKQNNIIFEPIPRITPRPGDLILQGSNNSAIILTTTRGYDNNNKPEKGKSNAGFESSEALVDSGTIDLVVGRGRKRKEQSEVHDEASTQPRIIKNIRDQIETNKNPLYYESEKNIGKPTVNRSSDGTNFNGNVSLDVPEGDPHLLDDAARIYVSMKMDADKSLGLDAYGPQSVPKPGSSNAGQNLPASKESSTVLMRADELRLVARKDDERGINGSIRIIKEGIANDQGGQGSAVIMIQPDGTIVIDGPKILIGGEKLIGDNGAGIQVSIGLGAEEPLVLGNELKLRLEEFMDATTSALDALMKHTHPGFPGPYPPDPDFLSTCINLKTKITTSKQDLIKTLSKIGKTR